jgi:hypothetical protein
MIASNFAAGGCFVRELVFRRQWGTAVWHWSAECSTGPTTLESEERMGIPKGGQVCNECRVHDREPAAPKGA